MLERLSSQSDKVWKQEEFENSNFPTLYWIGKNLGVQPKLIFKNPSFLTLSWIRKNWEVHQEEHSKITIFNLFVLPFRELGKSLKYSLWGHSFMMLAKKSEILISIPPIHSHLKLVLRPSPRSFGRPSLVLIPSWAWCFRIFLNSVNNKVDLLT